MTPLTEGEKAKRPLNLEEAMEYLRVSRVTMLKLFQTGQVKARKVCREWPLLTPMCLAKTTTRTNNKTTRQGATNTETGLTLNHRVGVNHGCNQSLLWRVLRQPSPRPPDGTACSFLPHSLPGRVPLHPQGRCSGPVWPSAGCFPSAGTLPCRGCRMTRAEAFEAASLQRVGATSDHDHLAFLCGFEMVRDKVEQCEAFNDEEGGAE